MRQSGATYAVSLDLAQDRAGRDRQAADAWRRIHAQPDGDAGDASESTELHRLRGVIARLLASALLRQTRSAT